MTKVNFKDYPDLTTPLNAENLNKIQSLEYAYIKFARRDVTSVSAWGYNEVQYNSSSDTFASSGSFSRDENGIKCNFQGPVLIIRGIMTNVASNDLYLDNELGQMFGSSRALQASSIDTSNQSKYVVSYTKASGDFILYGSYIIVIRL